MIDVLNLFLLKWLYISTSKNVYPHSWSLAPPAVPAVPSRLKSDNFQVFPIAGQRVILY